VPRRSLSSKLVPLPGRARWYQWHERVPFEALPGVRLADPQSWLIAADAPLAVRSGESMEWLWQGGARAARIGGLLRHATRGGRLGLRQVADLQSDVGVERASRVIAQATALVEDRTLGTQAAEVVHLLDGWDGRAQSDSASAAAYYVFLNELLDSLLRDRV